MYILLTFCPTKHIRIQPTIRTVQSLGNTWDQKETQATNTTIALLYKGITLSLHQQGICFQNHIYS